MLAAAVLTEPCHLDEARIPGRGPCHLSSHTSLHPPQDSCSPQKVKEITPLTWAPLPSLIPHPYSTLNLGDIGISGSQTLHPLPHALGQSHPPWPVSCPSTSPSWSSWLCRGFQKHSVNHQTCPGSQETLVCTSGLTKVLPCDLQVLTGMHHVYSTGPCTNNANSPILLLYMAQSKGYQT